MRRQRGHPLQTQKVPELRRIRLPDQNFAAARKKEKINQAPAFLGGIELIDKKLSIKTDINVLLSPRRERQVRETRQKKSRKEKDDSFNFRD
jgi:hypothetical protein